MPSMHVLTTLRVRHLAMPLSGDVVSSTESVMQQYTEVLPLVCLQNGSTQL